VTRREDDDAADVDALLAGPEQAKFNADIERWLLDVHAQCPIIRRGAEG
jgi:hypothetical protein